MLEDVFAYRNGALFCEDAGLTTLAAAHGTPAYVYSQRGIIGRFQAYEDALSGLPHRVCYAVKANSNLAVLSVLAKQGAGFDIVSGGELYRVIKAGGDPGSVVFSGVGKTEAEIRFALENRIHSFNCESEAELELISRVASSLRLTASIAIRVNPDVDAQTHPYISTGLRAHKFGIDIHEAEALYTRAAQLPALAPVGVSCHIGSQLLDMNPLLEAADKTIALIERLRSRGFNIRYLDLGGGLGVPYRPGESAVLPAALLDRIRPKLAALDLTLMLEPGRSIVAEAGILLTRVLLVKRNAEKTFVIVDAGMNDLIRPALYQAHHQIVPVEQSANSEEINVDIVGPVCETGDFFAHNRALPAVAPGSLLAILTAGAYGFALSSNYNSRPRPCELLVDGTNVRTARQRETLEALVQGEEAFTANPH